MLLTNNVILAGLTAAGKTTHGHMLAGQYGLRYISSSQILLSLLGQSLVQQRHFWVTEAAKQLWTKDHNIEVDKEITALEQRADWAVFDAPGLPWMHRRNAFTIWLESSLKSRVMKAYISHRSSSDINTSDIQALIGEKDHALASHFLNSYGFDLLTDRSPFDLVIDISECIASPTIQDSWKSIADVHSVISPAVGWYFTQAQEYRSQFHDACIDKPLVRILHCNENLR
jgi:cytidylate kinase